MHETYDKLIELLNSHKATYRLIDHDPEGQTEEVSALRGHPVAAAAKCIVLIVKIGKKTSRFVLAVVPGNARVDTGKIKSLFPGATSAGFAAADVVERLAGSVAGTVLPFAFHPDLLLIADPSITQHEELFFNAARLDRSMALRFCRDDEAPGRRTIDPQLPSPACADRTAAIVRSLIQSVIQPHDGHARG